MRNPGTISIKNRVANGYRWLDENFPGWQERVNSVTLNMADPRQCICGQVFDEDAGRWMDGWGYANNLFSEANSWVASIVPMSTDDRYGRRSRVSIALGFLVGQAGRWRDDIEAEWEALRAEWVRRLRG